MADLDIASQPDGTITLTLSPVALHDRAVAAVQQSIEIVRRRIDETGVVDPADHPPGRRPQSWCSLPGIGDPDRIKQLLGKTAHMTFQLVDEQREPAGVPPPPGRGIPADAGQSAAEDRGAQAGRRRRRRPDRRPRRAPIRRPAQWVVNFTFNSVGARRFADVTRANVGRRFAIVLDDKVISAPVIREPITGGSRADQRQLHRRLGHRSRACCCAPARCRRRSRWWSSAASGRSWERTPSAPARSSLGVGFVFVIAFMGMFYGLFGWFANLALVVNLVLMLAIMSLLQATLTLPGMAGILLTLGMAVDANILINERIREEQQERPPAAGGAGTRVPAAPTAPSSIPTRPRSSRT